VSRKREGAESQGGRSADRNAVLSKAQDKQQPSTRVESEGGFALFMHDVVLLFHLLRPLAVHRHNIIVDLRPLSFRAGGFILTGSSSSTSLSYLYFTPYS